MNSTLREEFLEIFPYFDANVDENISLGELKSRHFPHDNGEGIEFLFGLADYDSDLNLSKSEFPTLVAVLFYAFDTVIGEEDVVSGEELTRGWSEYFGLPLSEYQIAEYVSLGDANGDGNLNYNEFQEMLTTNPMWELHLDGSMLQQPMWLAI